MKNNPLSRATNSYTRNDVLKAISNLFPGKDSAVILNELDKYDGSTDAGASRVKLAILKLSSGNIDRLKYYAHIASQDFRDVILWAEYGYDVDDPLPNPYEKLLG